MRINLLTSLTFILTFFVCTAYSQDRQLGKAINALLKDNDIEKAKSLVLKYEAENKPNPQSKFASFRIHLQSGKSTDDLDSAYEELKFSMSNYVLLTEKEGKTNCNLIDFCPEKFNYYLHTCDSLLFVYYTKENDILTISLFIKRYPENPYLYEAKLLKNRISYLNTKATNTEDAYEKFLVEYPEGSLSDSARHLLWDVAFSNANSINTIEALSNVIKKYPDAPQVEATKNALWQKEWELTLEMNSRNSFVLFSENYPNAPQVKDALKKIEEIDWNETVAAGNTESYENFISNYPNSTKINEADSIVNYLRRIDELNDIVNQARESIGKYQISETKDLINNIENNDPRTFLLFKDSISKIISIVEPMLNNTLGKFRFFKNGVEGYYVFGIDKDENTLYFIFQSFVNGKVLPNTTNEETGISGYFQFGTKPGQLLLDWKTSNEANDKNFMKNLNTMNISKFGNDVNLKLLNGTIYKKVSDDFEAEIESEIKPAQPKNKAKKYVWFCGEQYEEGTNFSSALPDEWEMRANLYCLKNYREGASNIYYSGFNNNGILVTVEGELTGSKHIVLFLCDGSLY